MTRSLAALVLALLLALPAAPAAAKRAATLAPPGNSAVTEYLETVPNAYGASPPRPGGPHDGLLSAAGRRALLRLGADGRALAAMADATAPPAVPGAGGASAGARGGAAAPGAAAAGDGGLRSTALSAAGAPSRIDALLAAAAGRDAGGGMGPALPALMGVAALWALAHALRRRGAGR